MTPDSADFSFLSLTVVPRLSQGVSERGGVILGGWGSWGRPQAIAESEGKPGVRVSALAVVRPSTDAQFV